ncbi:MAG: YtxH domain-containing protein [Fibrobacteria bacterium]|nr:YtxH domain-containing protein [Fibrobacteria bacterium]
MTISIIIKFVLGAIIGGGLGFAFYKFIGCTTGTCPITSNPWISTIYGAAIGILIVKM